MVSFVFLVSDQVLGDLPTLVQRNALESACKVEANELRFLRLRHFHQLIDDRLAWVFVLQGTLDGPTSNGFVLVLH